MWDRDNRESDAQIALHRRAETSRGRRRRLVVEGLEGRQLMVASIGPIDDLAVPANLGQVIPLDGGDEVQSFSVSSDNPNVSASIIDGTFLSIDVSHESSGTDDPAFSGTLTFQLFDELTPVTVDRILALTNQGFYTSPTENPNTTFENFDTKNFHRVATGFPGSEFIVQGGSLNGDGTGNIDQPGFEFDDEFVPQIVFNGTGQLAMANAGDDTNSSQFFINTGQPRFLDFQHTIFGQLVDGFETFQLMTEVARASDDTPISPILISDTDVFQDSADGVLLLDTRTASAGESAMVTVVSTTSSGETATESFDVSVIANTENQRAILGEIEDQIAAPGETSTFQLTAINTNPDDTLTFGIGSGVGPDGTFAPVANATATVSDSGEVTIVPNTGFTGTIDLLVGVRDQVNRNTTLDAVANFDTQRITLTITDNNRPTASTVTENIDQNETVTISLSGDSNDSDVGQTVTFELTSPPISGTLANFDEVNGTVDYTPIANFNGTDSFTYRVIDDGEPTPNLSSADAVVNIGVGPGEIINQTPEANPTLQDLQFNTAATIVLDGNDGDPDLEQEIVFDIDLTDTVGTVTDFDPSTGSLVYTPPLNFTGTDTFTFTVTDDGPSDPNPNSASSIVTFNVIGDTETGAVRRIGGVLLVTPPPGTLINPTPNIIGVGLSVDEVVVTLNGELDSLRTPIAELDQIVVFGSRASDTITVAAEVPIRTTLNGGLGGVNTITANNASSQLFGWFGKNTLRGGTAQDTLVGRFGNVRFLPSEGDDLLYAGERSLFPDAGSDFEDGQGVPPTGQFFRFVNDRVVPVSNPRPFERGRFVRDPIPLAAFPVLSSFLPSSPAPSAASLTTDSPMTQEPTPVPASSEVPSPSTDLLLSIIQERREALLERRRGVTGS